MKFRSNRLGEIDVDPDCVLSMPEGMLGFSGSRRYVVVPHRRDGPFRWLQSLDDPDLSFLVVDPWIVRPDYEPIIPQSDAQALGLGDDSLKVVYAVVTVPPGDPEQMTANLLGPVIINAERRIARQVVVLNDSYTTEYHILDGLRAAAAPPEQTAEQPAKRAA
jgi:flagellar assembly factor FliW